MKTLGWPALVALLIVSPIPAARAGAAVDLRAQLTPVKSQGSHRNTCSAFAATALAEFLIRRERGEILDLSEAYAYWEGKDKALDSEYLRGMYRGVDGQAGYLAVKAYESGSMLE